MLGGSVCKGFWIKASQKCINNIVRIELSEKMVPSGHSRVTHIYINEDKETCKMSSIYCMVNVWDVCGFNKGYTFPG